jgi:hypothetical protein
MSRDPTLFDLQDPEHLYILVRRNLTLLGSSKVKETERLLFAVFGLNHLREWIAPRHDGRQPATSDEEAFSLSIYSDPDYDVVRRICNRSKHLSTAPGELTAEYGTTIGDWPSLDSVMSMDAGPPIGFEVDGQNLLEILERVAALYETWFHPPN